MKKGYKRKPFSKIWKKRISKSLIGKTGIEARNWKGGMIFREGYCYIFNPNHPRLKSKNSKYVKRSILTMERYLCRYLNKNEIVHHINHNKSDDRICNLQIVSRKEHKKIHNNIGKSTRIKKNQHLSKKTEFKKGNIPWNKGLKLKS